MLKQQTLQSLFSKKAAVDKTQTKATTKTLTHEDPKVQAYYNQLTPQQQVAHQIAVTHLGTSYDVTRTHGFLKFQK